MRNREKAMLVVKFLTRKRGRKLEKKLKIKRHQQLQECRRLQSVKQHFGLQSSILNMLADVAKVRISGNGTKLILPLPETFSVIDDPEGVIRVITEQAMTYRNARRKIRHIYFDHANLLRYDLAANALADIVAVEILAEQRARRARKKLKIQGSYPTNPDVKRFIKSLGIIKHMEVAHEAPNAEEAEKIKIFDVRLRHYLRTSSPTKATFKDQQCKKFVDHINACLAECNRTLTPAGINQLTRYTTEIVDNAEQHAGFVDWTIQGYLDTHRPSLQCEVAIFNFGRSIADTFLDLPRTSFPWAQVKPYVDKHESNGWFGTNWREQDLLTVVALQGRISSKNESSISTRGHGTVDLIGFFQQVTKECNSGSEGARMAILSGSTFIAFDGAYAMDPETERIAFNKTNSLEERPDPTYVRSLGQLRFPGTIISIRFPLALEHNAMVSEVHDE